MAASEEMYDTNIYRYHFTCPHTLDTYIKIVLDVLLTMCKVLVTKKLIMYILFYYFRNIYA